MEVNYHGQGDQMVTEMVLQSRFPGRRCPSFGWIDVLRSRCDRLEECPYWIDKAQVKGYNFWPSSSENLAVFDWF